MSVQLNLQCGVDFWVQFVATDDAGSAVTVTAPKMEIRSDANSGSTLLYTSQGGSPTIVITQPSANVVLASISSAASKNVVLGVVGSWDAVATDPSGKVIPLGAGPFVSTPNVTVL